MHAPDVEVVLSNGERSPLSELYRERALVLVFLRHFGCLFCKEQVAQLRVHSSLNIAFVSMATPEVAEGFRARMRCPHPFIADPERALYQAFGLGAGDGRQMFSVKTFARGFGATLRGHMVGLPIGDPWQMPGVFLIQPDGLVSWEYRSVHAADNVSGDALLRQLSG